MRRRRGSFPHRRHLLVAVIVGAAVGALPALASSATEPTVSAICASECSSFYAKYAWSPSEAAVASGGAVKFANATPGTPHGIVWSSSLKPSCDSSVPVGEAKSSSEAWSGSCTFAQAGTYTYYCSVHGTSMSGTITVSSSGTTTSTTVSPPPSTEPTSTTGTPSPPPTSHEALLAGPVSEALKLAKSQRGSSVRGSLDISKAAVGGRLQIDLLAQSAALAKAKHARRVRVGRLARGGLSTGRLSFSVRLDRRAREALAHRRRLALTVRISLTAGDGQRLTIARPVVLHV